MMNKLRKIVFMFLAVMLLAGCDSISSNSKTEKEVKDSEIIDTLNNQVIGMQNLPATIGLYTKGEGKKGDYNTTDKLLYGIESRISAGAVPAASKEQIDTLSGKGITNVSTYITVNDVETNIQKNFGVISIKHENVTGCPNYIYDGTEKVYYIQEGCTSTIGSYIISYIDTIAYKDNNYYVTVYAGLVENNTVYADFDKKTVVKTLNSGELYSVEEDKKGEFTKFKYTFKKNSDGNYVFENFKRV